MKDTKTYKYDLWLIILFLFSLYFINSFEITISIILGLYFFLFSISRKKIYRADFEIISFLIVILVIGFASVFFGNPNWYDLIKDLLYYSKPILLILIGYLFAIRINNWKIIFKAILLYGFFISVYHISSVVCNFPLTGFSVTNIRNINGLDNPTELISLILILISFKYPAFNIFKQKKYRNIVLIILSISFVLYLSRTMFIGLIIISIASFGYAKFNKKGLKYILISLSILIGIYIILNHIKIDRKSVGFKNFLYKMKIAPEEIFVPKIDLKNHATLWDHWRAYEAYCAIDDMNKEKISYIAGKGFGAKIDLKFYSPVGEKPIRFIPILHNGYIYILFKTGFIGLILYLVFLFIIYSKTYILTENEYQKFFQNLVSAIALYYLFSTLIITGMYNAKDLIGITLGMFLYLSNKNLYIKVDNHG